MGGSISRGAALGVVGLLLAGPAAAAAPAGASGPGYLRMKLVRVIDQHGFEKPLTALTVLVPVDWSFDGTVRYDPKNVCTVNLVSVGFRAASPDGRTSVELFPAEVWTWSDDAMNRQFMQQDLRTKASFGVKGCPVGPPVSVKDYLKQAIVARARPGARVVSSEVDPEAARAVADQCKQVEAQAAKAGIPMRLKGETARLKVEYERKGQPVDEWFAGVTFSRGTPMPTYDPATGRIGQAMSWTYGSELVFGAAAPRGQLPASEKLFRSIIASVRVDPAWQARIQQVQANMEAANVKGAADRSRIIAKSAEETRQIMSGAYQRRQESQDRISEQWSQTMRGVETFRDPRSGETVELSNRYGNAWSNGKDEYLLSDSPGFDPNTVSRENWTRLEPVKR